MPHLALSFISRFAWLLLALYGENVFAAGDAQVGSIDHIRILVNDIDAARHVLRDNLGFHLPNAKPYVYDEGSAHDDTELADDTYLELIAVANAEKLVKVRPWIVNFLEHQEGAHSVGLLVSSAKSISDRLQSQGIDAPIFRLARSKPEDPPVLLVTPKLTHVPDGAIFFLEYPQNHLASTPPALNAQQPNTAQRILAVWIVVKDLERASEEVQALGFHLLRSTPSKALGADAREFATDRGNIVLLHASSQGPAALFARERGEGIMGFTLSVSDLVKARLLVEKNTRRHLFAYRGLYGDSVLIPRDLAFGTWIELTHE